jgi:ABC-type antimicrobial peptide transport system permease subunit
MGCANVAVSLLVRSAMRAQETATRLAMGATRWDLVRQSLSDALVLTALGGVVGMGLASAPWRFSTWALGLIALTLTSFGVFATLSQSVVERTREIGIRVAVGAVPRQVTGLVFREGAALTIAGTTLGSVAAMLVGGLLERLLFEVKAIDAVTLAAVATLFGLVSAIAVYIPVWRAARLDPTVALRRQ